MNFSEYLQLDEALKANGSSVAKEFGLSTLNEAPMPTAPTATKPKNVATKAPVQPTEKKLDTETQSLSLLTRWGRMKAKLNRTGQKIQKDINQNVIQKYLPTVLETEKQTLQAIAAAAKQNKGIEGIKQVLKSKQAEGGALQQKQMQALYGAIDQSLANTTARLDKTIEGSKMNDKNKNNVKNYWVLLSTQIKMNAYAYIAQTINASAKAIIGANANILKAYQENDVIIADAQKRRKKAEGEIETLKPKLAAAPSDFNQEDSQPTSTGTIEKGKTYDYSTKDGKKYLATVLEDAPDSEGKIAVSLKDSPTDNMPVKTRVLASELMLNGKPAMGTPAATPAAPAAPVSITTADIGKSYTYTDPTDKSVSQAVISHVDDAGRVFITKPDGKSKRIEPDDVSKVLTAATKQQPAQDPNANPAETKGI